MKLLKPSWVHHNEQSIFSIDVHPDSSRFATAGQGSDSGKIVIWNMGPVIDSKKEKDDNSPKILCQMDHHIACVNVVRWSNNGLFLASGSDDKLVMIWQYAAQGGMSYQNIENWKCGFTLRGHSGDVMDLAWSAKDQYLASCSVDNTVIIWNALKFPDIITRINAHAGLVKGVAWDPVGTYFASQSDDKTLKIWRTLDWSLEKCIDEPFKNCAGTTHVLRCNWSPDGQLVISAHAMNNGAPTAQVIDRGNKWSTKLDFVGHRKAVTAVRFFPSILKPNEVSLKQDPATSLPDIKTHCLFALGSRDRSISIWLTNYSRPLCVIRDLFDNPIMDLSWSKSPNPGLLACSMDGTISYIEFDYTEIGMPQTKKEREEFFFKKYSYDINASVGLKQQSNNGNILQAPGVLATNNSIKKTNDSIKFVENVEILMAQEQKQQQAGLASISENSPPMNLSFDTSCSALKTAPNKLRMLTENQKQIERKMSDGRRRITPICVSKPGEYDTPKPFGMCNESNLEKVGFERSIGFGSPESKFISKTATESSTIIIEKRDEKDEVVDCSPVKSIVYTKSTSQMNSSNSQDPITTINTITSSVSTLIKTSIQDQTKKTNLDYSSVTFNSVGPTKVPTAASTPSASLAKFPIAKQASLTTTSSPAVKPTQSTAIMTASPVSSKLNKPSNTRNTALTSTSMNLSTKLTNTGPNQDEKAKDIQPIVSEKPTLVPTTPSKNRPVNISSASLLVPLKIDRNFLTKIICERTSSRCGISVEIHNSISLINRSGTNISGNKAASDNSNFNLSLVKYIYDGSSKWQTYFTSPVCEVACSSYLLAAVCSDSTIHINKAINGTQICCPILLDSRAAVLKCNTNYCMALTTSGFVYVWKYSPDHTSTSTNNKLLSAGQTLSDLNNLTTLINRESCTAILREGVFVNALLTDNGVPVIYMSKNRSFFYSIQTQCWHQVPVFGTMTGEESHLLFNTSSSFAGHAKSMSILKNDTNKSLGPLSIIQLRDKSFNMLKTIDLMSKSSLSENPLFSRQDFTLMHLESQMNACVGLNSPKEYKFWLLTYARYLVENEYEDKLTDLCNFLLGPLYSLNWNELVLTFKKRDLLQEILAITAQNLQLQRLHSYYKQQLSIVGNLYSKSSIMNRLTAPSSAVTTRLTSKLIPTSQNTDLTPSQQTTTTHETNINDDVNMQEDTSEFDTQDISPSTENKTVSECLNVVEKIKETLEECQVKETSDPKESGITEICLEISDSPASDSN